MESFNPGGSAKDRSAHAMVEAARARGELTEGTTVVESSSGNLGVAMSREAVLGGFSFVCVVDPRTNDSTIARIRAYGAQVEMITEPDPATGDWLTARRTRVAELLDEIEGSLWLDQYSNTAAFTAHEKTMGEIIDELGHDPSDVYVAVSTAGTVGGCLRRTAGTPTRVHAVDAEGSVLYGGARGVRQLPGYGAGVVTELSKQETPDAVSRISALEAIEAARELGRCEAILPGASGGAVMSALAKDFDSFAPGSDIVVILHDDGAAYTNTIYNDDWVKELQS